MNDHMEGKMEQTIRFLQASMPNQKQKKIPLRSMMQIAWSEVNAGFLVVVFAAVLICGLAAVKLLHEPMLVMFCTMPLPLILLFHRYILCENASMRELEETFRYSYTEMLAARTTVISLLTLFAALGSSLVVHGFFGESFFRLALCGSTPCTYLCILLLFLCQKVRSQDVLAILTAILWVSLSFVALQFSFDQMLQLCSTGLYALLVGAGIILYALCLRQIRRRSFSYEPDLR